ncbi:hypothetical protein M0R45_000789 [Rubus argutus]|uniref:ABC transporter domain-containing protein n=1 Tax=Rubus argutus TaxID=59490 RepID=A0AAW1VKE6_RUBAR
MAYRPNDHPRRETVIDIGRPKPANFTGGLEFTSLTYTVTKKTKVEGKWLKQEVDLLHKITGFAPKGCITAVMGPSGAGKSTFLDGVAGRIARGSLKGRVGADFNSDKKQRVEKLIQQLGLSSARNTYIGDEGTRGVSGGERRRVSIGVDIIHGPALLFLDEPTSGLDSTSAHSVIEKVHHIARSGSTVILTIHQPSARIQLLLDHMIILARGQLMYQGSPKDVSLHLGRMGQKVHKEESPVEHLIDIIQEYDQSEHGVEALAEFARTGVKPPRLAEGDVSISTILPTPTPPRRNGRGNDLGFQKNGKRLPLQTSTHVTNDFDHSVRSPYNTSRSWTAGNSGVMETLHRFTPSRKPKDNKMKSPLSASPGYNYSSEIIQNTPTPHSSDYTVNENDYLTPEHDPNSSSSHHHLAPKFSNSFLPETWILMRRNFKNIRRTPELFLSRLFVLTFMGFLMATMFKNPPSSTQGITNRLSFFIFTVCLFFFSSNDAVPAFIQERFIFVRETAHNAYRASSYTIAGLITYLPFLALQASVYAGIVWYALKLRGPFLYFLVVLYVSLLSTNSFVVFVSSVVPNYILGYAAVIAFTALFFLFCGYFLNSHDIPLYWKWMNYVSTMTYPYEGETLSSVKKWEKIYIMLGWTVLYRILFYLVIRFFSKNQRT